MPDGLDWVGRPVKSIERLVAARPALVHFFDFAQLNSVRVLPYLRAWHERYEGDGLALVGIHSPRFPFTQSADAVAGAAERLGISWSVALDPMFAVWRMYEPHGWPALFLWGRGGALRWYHLGEGEYAGTEEAIREALEESGAQRDWPPTVEPLRPSDVPGTEVIAPTPEQFPGGSTEGVVVASTATPPSSSPTRREAPTRRSMGSARSRSAWMTPSESRSGLGPGARRAGRSRAHPTTSARASPSPGLRIYSIQFAAAPAR